LWYHWLSSLWNERGGRQEPLKKERNAGHEGKKTKIERGGHIRTKLFKTKGFQSGNEKKGSTEGSTKKFGSHIPLGKKKQTEKKGLTNTYLHGPICEVHLGGQKGRKVLPIGKVGSNISPNLVFFEKVT